jgi:taurine dioxygenase
MSLSLAPLGPGAAEITGLDCARDLDNADILRAVKRAFVEYPVLVFRDQVLTAPQLAGFGRRFGLLESYAGAQGKSATSALHQTGARETPDQMLYQHPDDTDVLIMTNEIREGLPVIGIVDNAEIWHSDGSHKTDPYAAIIVNVVRNPASGGDTEFCDLRAVYEALTPNIKAALDGKFAIHHWSKALNPRFAGMLDAAAQAEGERIAKLVPEMRQPIVRTHPDSGKPSLYISPRFTLRIDGIDQKSSDVLLDALFAFTENPAFHYRHSWREKDLMIWDNRCLNHRVRSYDAQDIRCRHRVTVSGDKVFYRA